MRRRLPVKLLNDLDSSTRKVFDEGRREFGLLRDSLVVFVSHLFLRDRTFDRVLLLSSGKSTTWQTSLRVCVL